MTPKKKREIQKALAAAGMKELLLERFVEDSLAACDESCYSGCSKCCSSGTANRAFADVEPLASR